MAPVEREYHYNMRWSKLLVLLVAFFFCSWAVVAANTKYYSSDKWSGKIEFGTVVLWLVTAPVFVTNFFVLFLAYDRLFAQRRVAFTSEGLIVPRWRFSRREKQIAYRSIRELSVRVVNESFCLDVAHDSGKYTLRSVLMRSQAEFHEIYHLLSTKLHEAWETSPQGEPSTGPELTA